MYFVCGGSDSGKSEFAERLALSKAKGKIIYIATMLETSDKSVKDKIARHRARRPSNLYETLVLTDGNRLLRATENLENFRNRVVLLDCLAVLTANTMYAVDKSYETTTATKIHDETKIHDDIITALNNIKQVCREILVVSQNLFGTYYPDSVTAYLQLLGRIHQSLAKEKDCQVFEVLLGKAVKLN